MAKGIILRKLQYMPINSHGRPMLIDAEMVKSVEQVTDTRSEYFGRTVIKLGERRSRYTLESVEAIERALKEALGG